MWIVISSPAIQTGDAVIVARDLKNRFLTDLLSPAVLTGELFSDLENQDPGRKIEYFGMTLRDSSQDRTTRNDRLDFLNIYKKLPWAVGVFCFRKKGDMSPFD